MSKGPPALKVLRRNYSCPFPIFPYCPACFASVPHALRSLAIRPVLRLSRLLIKRASIRALGYWTSLAKSKFITKDDSILLSSSSSSSSSSASLKSLDNEVALSSSCAASTMSASSKLHREFWRFSSGAASSREYVSFFFPSRRTARLSFFPPLVNNSVLCVCCEDLRGAENSVISRRKLILCPLVFFCCFKKVT